MTLATAIQVVRAAFLEEGKGTKNGPHAQKYAAAVKDFPVTIAIAAHMFAAELSKSS